MKTCDERWRDEVLDHAAGIRASTKLALHLSGCAVCSAALLEGQERMARIDMGLRRLTSAEASPQAIPRVLAAVRGQRSKSRLLDWQWVTGIVATAAILIAVAGYLRTTHERDRRVLSAAAAFDRWRSPTQGLLQSYGSDWLSASPGIGQSFYRLNGAAQTGRAGTANQIRRDRP